MSEIFERDDFKERGNSSDCYCGGCSNWNNEKKKCMRFDEEDNLWRVD